MEFNYKVGQRLVIELQNQMCEGDCYKSVKNRIDLVNVVEYPNRNPLKGLLSFYSCEILSIRILDDEQRSISSSFLAGKMIENGIDKAHQVIIVRRDEYIRLSEMTKSYVYMATTDNRYLKAVEHLSNCESIGVVGIDYRIGRLKPLNLLVLCSWDQVYIFDLFLFNKKAFEPELKAILESDDIKKVVHDSRMLVDCLWHQHKVKLNNLFDTSVAELKVRKIQTGNIPKLISSLSESLEYCLNFPSTLLESALKITVCEWENRPLLESTKINAAQLAIFLITLKEKQEQFLLKNLYNTPKVLSQLTVNSIKKSSDEIKTASEKRIREYL